MAMDLCREEGNRVPYTEFLVHLDKQGVHASEKRRRDRSLQPTERPEP
jgi:hypothetical protein